MKWWKNIGEVKIQKKLKPYYGIYQFGRKGWNGKKNLTLKDKQLAERGLKFAEQILAKKKPNLLILDEINLAVAWKLLKEKKVIDFLKLAPKSTDIVVTGRYAPKSFVKLADYVNEIKLVKMPRKIITKKGIQY